MNVNWMFLSGKPAFFLLSGPINLHTFIILRLPGENRSQGTFANKNWNCHLEKTRGSVCWQGFVWFSFHRSTNFKVQTQFSANTFELLGILVWEPQLLLSVKDFGIAFCRQWTQGVQLIKAGEQVDLHSRHDRNGNKLMGLWDPTGCSASDNHL